MRYVGIDYGTKRIGIALSDDDGRMAFPAGVITNHGNDAACKEVAARIRKERVGLVVIGVPIGLGGEETEQTRITQSFIKMLKKIISIRIKTENEMLTSKIAGASGMTGDHIDASSAAIILQSYLDRKTLNSKL